MKQHICFIMKTKKLSLIMKTNELSYMSIVDRLAIVLANKSRRLASANCSSAHAVGNKPLIALRLKEPPRQVVNVENSGAIGGLVDKR